jgi:hypothetical protein
MTPPAAAAAEALPRRRPAPSRAPVRHPRRVSGPARPSRPAPRAVPRTDDQGLVLRAIGAYERVCDSALLDRIVRGRLWIGLLAFALIGIVAMQWMVLKLNTGIGATLAREAALERSNAQLGIEAATGSGEGRIEPLAAATGMTFAPSGSVHFVASSPDSDIARAASVLAAPIQPHESVAGAETQTASTETTSREATSAETAAAKTASTEPGGEESTASSTESAHESQTQSSEASSPPASVATTGESESEAPASAAGGVAAGH